MRIPQEQIDQANRTDLVYFLESQGEKVHKEGKNYRWNKYVLIKGNKWVDYDPNGKRQGYPIQFVEIFFGLSFRDAVDRLLGNGRVISPATAAEQKKEFRLPDRDSNNDHVIKYLTKRGVSLEVINYFIDRGDLYQETGRFHNAVFLGRDLSGTPRYCFKRGTQDYTDREGKEHKFRNEPEGSDKRFSFSRTGSNNKLCLFESCIDLLSFMTLFPESRNTHLLSLAGTGTEALSQYVKDHPSINFIFLCLDNDPAGKQASERIGQSIPASFKVAKMIPTKFKDWNELLQHYGEVQKLYDIEQREI